jgi:hypothetical protein
MAFLEIIDDRVPKPIRDRVRVLREEVDAIYDAAMRCFVTDVPRRISFKVSGNSSTNWNGDLMPPEERAQAVSFIVRFEHLRDDLTVRIGPIGDEWHITNLWELRHMLNDVRPIIQNQKDCTYYTKVNATIQKRLRRTDTIEGMRLQVYEGDSENEVTLSWATYLGENTRAIAAILDRLDYGYLYNGILQHSDVTLSERFLRDYTSGEYNYVLWKHVIVLGQIQYWLTPYYRVLRILNFPALGSLVVRTEDAE